MASTKQTLARITER